MGVVARLTEAFWQAMGQEAAARGVVKAELQSFDLGPPRQEGWGDFAGNAALVNARVLRASPREIAAALRHRLLASALVESVDIAGPGFLNVRLSAPALAGEVQEILARGAAYGRSEIGGGERIQVEFVSANPTGPLHVGHGRGAVVGDSLARILEAAGFQVSREFYINDAPSSRQMQLFAESVEARYLEEVGRPATFPEDGYRGEYVRELARMILEERGTEPLEWPADQRRQFFLEEGRRRMLEDQARSLQRLGLTFDVWFSERTLYEGQPSPIDETLNVLREAGRLYEREGALWLNSAALGDEKDRVLVRSDGTPTYLMPDLAYHRDKFARGFQRVIDLWGADHHGYVARMRAGLAALGLDPDRLEVLILQTVRLMRGGSIVPMSKREGELYTLDELVDEVGVDAVRFFFLLRSADSHLDFDLEQATQQSNENPVYYAQYAHARIRSILRQPGGDRIREQMPDADLTRLREPEERRLIVRLSLLEQEVASAAQARAPHRLTQYLLDIASLFHVFYTRHRVLSTPDTPVATEVSRARLDLVEATGIVLRNGLGLLGVSAPERM